jgi:hypothetical protein
MNDAHRSERRRAAGAPPDQGMAEHTTPELDSAAAEALALVTLYASGVPDDAELAGRLVAELLRDPDGASRIVRGLVSACAALLALHEHQTGTGPERTLQQLGRLIAQAAYS